LFVVFYGYISDAEIVATKRVMNGIGHWRMKIR